MDGTVFEPVTSVSKVVSTSYNKFDVECRVYLKTLEINVKRNFKLL